MVDDGKADEVDTLILFVRQIRRVTLSLEELWIFIWETLFSQVFCVFDVDGGSPWPVRQWLSPSFSRASF